MSQQNGYESTSISTDTIETIIGANTVFKGNVTTDNPIRIDGIFEGEISSTSLIVISATGKLSGTVECNEMQLYGHADGTILCRELLNIKSEAVCQGDVTTKNLVTVEGSVLDGTCKMLKMRQ